MSEVPKESVDLLVKEMAATALDEKINKIKLQNEEIRRRYEEVEADKKNAAKSNALVQMVPSSDWPERKEPPEFTSCNRQSIPQPKAKPSTKVKYAVGMEGKVMHKFAEGDGPPPDPKYNFLADYRDNDDREAEKKRERNRFSRGAGGKKRGNGREFAKQNYHGSQVPFKKEAPEYEAWRAERNRIDEARINRQKTAEGNWRREWDNNKIVESESAKKENKMKEDHRRDPKDYDKRYYHNGQYSNYSRINDPRVPHSPFKNTKGPQDAHRSNVHQHQIYSKTYDAHSVGNSERLVSGTNRNMKITINQGPTTPKGPVMSVKVNSPSIAGTGRVGPRQKTRVTYSTVSEGDANAYDSERSRFNDDRHNDYRPMPPKSPYSQRKKDQSHLPRNEVWKNDKVMHKRDCKEIAKPQRQADSQNNVPKCSGLQGRIERVRWDNAKSVELNKNADKTVDVANKPENEIQVVSEAEQSHLNDEETVNKEASTIENEVSSQSPQVEDNDEHDLPSEIEQFMVSLYRVLNCKSEKLQIETCENDAKHESEVKNIKEEGNIEMLPESENLSAKIVVTDSEEPQALTVETIHEKTELVEIELEQEAKIDLPSEPQLLKEDDIVEESVEPQNLMDEVKKENIKIESSIEAKGALPSCTKENENPKIVDQISEENNGCNDVVQEIEKSEMSRDYSIENLMQEIVVAVASSEESTTKDSKDVMAESDEFKNKQIILQCSNEKSLSNVEEILDTSKGTDSGTELIGDHDHVIDVTKQENETTEVNEKINSSEN